MQKQKKIVNPVGPRSNDKPVAFGPEHYVPILKAKRGEIVALKQLDAATRAAFTPIVELIPRDWDYKKQKYKKQVDAHVQSQVASIAAAWGDRLFLDCRLVEPEHDGANTQVMEMAHALARQLGVRWVPVLRLSSSDLFVTAVVTVTATDKLGACLRIDEGSLALPPSTLASKVSALLVRLGIKEEAVDLAVDLRAFPAAHLPAAAEKVAHVLAAIGGRPWRTLTVAGTSFPATFAGMGKGVLRLTRSEWELWTEHLPVNLSRKPTFGDYAIAHPDLPKGDPAVLTRVANIRYTVDDAWLVSRGTKLGKKPTFKQFRHLAGAIVRRPEYAGPLHCAGDAYVDDCARGGSTGTMEMWRRAGTNHHLTDVVDQISTAARGPAAPPAPGSEAA